MAAAPQQLAPEVARHRGYIRWSRFAMLLVPALLTVALLGAGAASGAVPVAVAMQGRQTVKITAKSLSLDATATFPQFFQTQDGQRSTVVAVDLRDLALQGLCASTRVDTPIGAYILRITSPDNGSTIRVGDLAFGLEKVDSFDFQGRQVSLNHNATTAEGIPTDSGDPGFLPIKIDGLGLDVNATVRWATANQVHLADLTVAGGRDQRECY